MTLTKPFRLPFPQKSSKSTNLATPTLTVNPTTDSLRARTSSKTINNNSPGRIDSTCMMRRSPPYRYR
ncbi:hypothetical protein Osc7112_6367 (plasmid) [Oscillatoria nigro-viridis PCC 7112]|uniref:Uncharacterized protein n=1 Tax=Phormidium nigroviride PCC 7112 TaxID=179408 RepID=K9VSJ3_9CYAN|nr:hypothetical protein Osc7112_6326 [Oscillatoria nigro-viridis PCC 7112]AFZ10524.1 hypothetical protein Osc7112_6367 [Oscillatoria nigro-viridis PCC 7112]